ncbi:MAG: PAC2 family protein, partial [Mycobacteriales bacterium]
RDGGPDASDLPKLHNTVVLAAFEGWNDAGDAASGALRHLAEAWDAETVAELDGEDYYDYQVNRPVVSVVDGERHLEWPTTTLAIARPAAMERDVLLVHGIEPNMRWQRFCAELVGAYEEAGASLVVTLGALLADTPHSRPVPVTGTASDPETAATLGLPRSRYEGPTGITGVLTEACRAAGIPALSLWAAVPHYVSQSPSPKATVALLRRVEDLLDLALDFGELEESARAWEATVDELAAEDTDISEYVRSLEDRSVTELPEASGEVIAEEFERFLRRRGRS